MLSSSVLLAASGGSGSGQQLTGLAGWVLDLMAALGAPGVALLVVLETFFPPVPSEIVLPLAGFLAGQGRMGLVVAWLAATLGALVGALLLYALGARLGQERSERLLSRVPLLDQDDLDRGEDWFHRHGDASVLLGRLVPGVRSLVSLPAGVQRMPVVRFSVLTTLGSAVWNAVLVGAGYLLGQRWRTVAEYSDYLNYAVYGALALVVARLVWRRRERVPFLPSPS